MREMRQKFSLVFLAFVLAGCVTTGGKNLDVSKITKGVSTRTDVVKLLGRPDREMTFDDGRMNYTWVSVKEKSNLVLGALVSKGIDSTDQERRNSLVGREVQTVQVTFSPEGVVLSVTTSKSGNVQ
jgi:outer membrane protein assembly factor BamE (lipoprotein component of BamABCDE complex)